VVNKVDLLVCDTLLQGTHNGPQIPQATTSLWISDVAGAGARFGQSGDAFNDISLPFLEEFLLDRTNRMNKAIANVCFVMFRLFLVDNFSQVWLTKSCAFVIEVNDITTKRRTKSKPA
jgi:hypothetical protein